MTSNNPFNQSQIANCTSAKTIFSIDVFSLMNGKNGDE